MPKDKRPKKPIAKAAPKNAPPNLAAAPAPAEGAPKPLPAHRKQAEIPGTERARIGAIDEKAAVYLAKRDARAKLQAEEKGLKAELTALLEEHKLESYHFVDGGVEYVVDIDRTETLRVSKADGGD